eukprot:1283595-Lingulodinium_polyedra.AAC.1
MRGPNERLRERGNENCPRAGATDVFPRGGPRGSDPCGFARQTRGATFPGHESLRRATAVKERV